MITLIEKLPVTFPENLSKDSIKLFVIDVFKAGFRCGEFLSGNINDTKLNAEIESEAKPIINELYSKLT